MSDPHDKVDEVKRCVRAMRSAVLAARDDAYRTAFVPSASLALWADLMEQLVGGNKTSSKEILDNSFATPSAERDTNGWLIEFVSNDLTIWWRGGDKQPWEHYGEPHWTRDAFKAVRFAREQDARAVIDGWPRWLWEKVKVLDHLFIGDHASRSSALPQEGATPLSDALDLNTLDSNDIRAWRTLARQLERRIACIADFGTSS